MEVVIPEGKCVIWQCDRPRASNSRSYCATCLKKTQRELPDDREFKRPPKPQCSECKQRPAKWRGLCKHCYDSAYRRWRIRTDAAYAERERARCLARYHRVKNATRNG